MSRQRLTGERVALAVLDGFLALTAAWGAIVVVPALPVSMLLSGPFSDFTVPALGLGLVALIAALGVYGAIRNLPLGATASMVTGAAIIVFELVEAAVVGNLLNVPPDMVTAGYVGLWLQPFYGVVGLALVVLGYRQWRHTSAPRRPTTA